MKKRIGLYVSKDTRKKHDATTTTTTTVEVETLAELSTALATLGARKVGLLRRDRLGASQIEGGMMPLSGLKPSHLDWLTDTAPQFETRGLFYETH